MQAAQIRTSFFYFSGKNSSEFEQTLNDTIDEIQKLNKEYVPDNND